MTKNESDFKERREQKRIISRELLSIKQILSVTPVVLGHV